MSRGVILLVSLLFAWTGALRAQVPHRMDSHGSEIVLTSWSPRGEAAASVLLVPGWGGGPSDVLGTAQYLSGQGIEAFVLSPRGWHSSGGNATFANALQDIGTALSWVRKHTTHDVAIGGHSFGGGMALAYAAQDLSVRRVVSIAGTDHGQLIRQYHSDASFAAMLEPILTSTAAPQGPIRFDVSSTLRELMSGQDVYGLRENAASLADRSILMFGGWEDAHTTVDDYLLPLYRALRSEGAREVRFVVFHTDHGFGNVRAEVHDEIARWLRGQ